ncbi:cytochrome P450 [Streptomyces fuscichromogenes]|uniref:cytochrome P450 n=1 Tax=Streptomyces fuscichromogenes TaxID=1324013 RepID=UPI0038152330
MTTEDATTTVRYYEDLGCWVVWGRDHVQAALQDPHLSSETLDAVNLSYLPADMHEECAHLIETMRRWFVLLDGTKHTEARRAVQPMFSPRRIRRLEETIHTILEEELDTFARSAGHDAMPDLADNISARTIALLLGLPDGQGDLLHTWARPLADFLAVAYRPDYARAAQASLRAMADFITNAPDEEGESIWNKAQGSEWDRLATSSMVMFGGLETTAGMIGLALWHMLGNNLTRTIAAATDDEPARAVVERVLELYAPLGHVARLATQDTTLAGHAIAKDDVVLVSLTGRDLFDHATPTTPLGQGTGQHPSDHIAFGFGMHYCVGAPLARLTVAKLLTLFARRFPDATVSDVNWRVNKTFRGFDRLVLDLHPATAPASAQH